MDIVPPQKKIVSTEKAPQAIGAYSQGIVFDSRLLTTTKTRILFTSGQLGMDPQTGEFVEGGVAAETERALENLKAVVEAGGSSMENVLKVTILLADINDFAVVNEIYARYFPTAPPARSAFQVSALPKGARIEIECIAAVS
ncbi:MAG: RidA family protein [Candidatus Electryoneaceae bacterium]|nr:RidA family protein [Candidatus Electryoneaceae bacterium]